MTKKRSFLVGVGTFAFSLFSLSYGIAQETQEDSLVLPDITTIISQEETLVTKDAIPDFSGALPETFDTDTIPEVSDVESIQDDAVLLQAEETQETPPVVFMEGEVGLGWPHVFDANFSLYQFGNSPFSINFAYDSFGGYGNNSIDMGFFDTNIEMEAAKIISAKNSTWNLAASYKTQDVGLQGNSVIFDDINRQTVTSNIGWTLAFGSGFMLSLDFEALWFSRFAGYAGDLQNVAKDEDIALSFLQGQPKITFSWQKDNFELGLDGEWTGGFFLGSNEENINRIQGNFFATFGFPVVNLAASLGVVYNHITNESLQTDFTVPFSLSTTFNFKLPFSEQKATLGLIGGLNSNVIDLCLLEKNNPFTMFPEEQIVSNSEQTDWFGQMAMHIPIKSNIELGVVADFRKTAFNNGILQTQKDNQFNSVTGLFNSEVVDSTRLATNISLSVAFSSFTTLFSWNSHWLDKTPGQSPQSLEASVSFITEKNWGLDLKVQENLGIDDDKVPVLDFSAFFKPSGKTKILLTVTDAIKLVTGKDRVFIEPYIQQGGKVSASVQFMY